MVSKNNLKHKLEDNAKRVPHYGIRKLSVGVASVLLSTTLYMGANAHADATTSPNSSNPDTTSSQQNTTDEPFNNQPAANSGSQNTVNNIPTSSVPEKSNQSTPNANTANNNFVAPATTNQQLSKSSSTTDNAIKYQPGTSGVNDEYNRYVKRTINITNPTNDQTTSEVQTIHFIRKDQNGNAGYYDQDQNLVFVDWTSDTNTFPAYNLPQYPGYQAIDELGSTEVTLDGKQVVSQKITPETLNHSVNVTYKPMANIQKIQIVNGNNVLKDYSIVGTTGQTKTIDQDALTPPEGYQLISGQTIPTQVIFNGQNKTPIILNAQPIIVTINANDNYTNQGIVPGTKNVHFPTGVAKTNLEHNVVRTVTITKPDGTSTTKQVNSATLNRTATFNAVTGELTYSNWSNNGQIVWDPIQIPEIKGYTPVFDTLAGKITVTPDTPTNINAEVTYAPIEQSITINYLDPYTNEAITTGQITGDTDQQVTYTLDEMNQDLANSGLAEDFDLDNTTTPLTVKFGTTPEEVNVKLIGKTIHLNADEGKTINDFLPDDFNYPKGVAPSDLNKTISRTITIVNPDGSKTTKIQSAAFSRGATINLGKNYDGLDCVTYDNWDNAEQTLPEFAAPVINGYTPDKSLASLTVNPESDNVNETIHYLANSQAGQITYIDNQGNQISFDKLTGKTGQVININLKAPAGWEIVKGQNIPTTVTVANNGIPGITIIVKHHLITIEPAKVPTATDKINGTTNKQPGDGLANRDIIYNDLHKTITRSVAINNPHTGVHQQNQTLKYTRTALIDDVTGEVNFNNWDSNQSFTQVIIPEVAGYTKHVTAGDLSGYTPSQNQINSWTDPKIEATYVANSQTGTITYIDDNGNTISTTPLTGKTDDVININPKAPAGWKITPGQNIPNTITVSANGIEGPAIRVEHNIITINPSQVPNTNDKINGTTNKQPGDGLANRDINYNDLHKTLTRTITINNPQNNTTKDIEQIKFQRAALIDDATGDISFSGWQLDPASPQTKFNNINFPVVPGYTMKATPGDHGEKTFTAAEVDNYQDPNIVVTYVPATQSGKISYVDNNGTEVSNTALSGQTGEVININPKAPANWEIVPGQNIPKTVTITVNGVSEIVIKIQHQHLTINPDKSKSPEDKLPDGTNYPAGVDQNDLNKTITRTININQPNRPAAHIQQTASFNRNAVIDLVTKNVVYGDWNLVTNNWNQVNVPQVDGYTPNINNIQNVNVTPDTENVTIDVNYLANAQTGKISYVDNFGNEISHTNLAGKTGDTISINPQAPANWKIIADQNIPTNIKVGNDGIPTIVVKIDHATLNVTPDSPKSTSDLLPDGTNYPNDVNQTDLNHSVTRKIIVNKPTGANTLTQTANFTRNATIDLVTKDVTYSDWKLEDNGLAEYTAPAVNGYTPSISKVDSMTPTLDTKDSTVTITYSANNQTQVINYVDDDGNIIKADNVTGQTGQNVTITPTAPLHWTIKSGQTVPANITLKDQNMPINIVIEPKLDPVTNENQLRAVITRKITVNYPSGTKSKTQYAHFTRTGTYNEVTGKTAYTDWTVTDNKLGQIILPQIPGYTASQKVIERITNPTPDMKLDDVVINYTKDEKQTSSATINYVDESGKVINTQTISGKIGSTQTLNIQSPEHWTIKSGQTIPTNITLKDQNAPINIVIEPKLDLVTDESQLRAVITRKIILNRPDRKMEIRQYAHFERTGTYNEVTGQTTYSNWQVTENKLREIKAPHLAGYTPSTKVVEGIVNPTPDMKLDNVIINYTPIDYDFNIKYIDNAGNVIKNDKHTVHIGDNLQINPVAPKHWVIKAGQSIPTHLIINGDGTDQFIIHLEPKVDPITDQNQLIKKLNRQITIEMPNGQQKIINQSAEFSRTGTFNEVTNQSSFTKWNLENNGLTQIDVPHFDGYTPSQNVISAIDSPTVDTQVNNIDITYTKNNQQNIASQVIHYVDDKGTVVKEQTLTGTIGQKLQLDLQAPEKWSIIKDQNVPSDIVLQKQNPIVNIRVTPKLDQITDKEQLNKTITRTITINTPNKKPTIIKQTAKFTRTGTTNEVTGETTFTNWHLVNNGFTQVAVPTINGYVASQSVVNAIDNPTIGEKELDVVVNYVSQEAQGATVTVKYIDSNGNVIGQGEKIGGKVGDTVALRGSTPDGWVAKDKMPAEYKFEHAGDQILTIKLKHGHVTVSADQGKTTRDVLPDSKSYYPSGVSKDDLNKTVTRTIKLEQLAKEPKIITQTAKLTRSADVDEVTGKVTYSDWKLEENGWKAYQVPTYTGYTASQAIVNADTPTEKTKDQTITITYNANNAKDTINFVDENNKIVGTQEITGTINDNIDLKLNLPNGYEFNQDIPKTININGSTINVKVKKITNNNHSDNQTDNNQHTNPSNNNHNNSSNSNKRQNNESTSNSNQTTDNPMDTSNTTTHNQNSNTHFVSNPSNDVSNATIFTPIAFSLNQKSTTTNNHSLPQTGNNQEQALGLLGALGLGLATMFGFKKKKQR